MNSLDKEKLLVKIAQLYYLENMRQDEIASKLNIHRVKVSRYLKEARETHLVEIKIKSLHTDYGDLENEIEKQYALKECIIVPDNENKDFIYKELGPHVTRVLERILAHGSVMGIVWGVTLKGVIAYMHSSTTLDIEVVPICGGIGPIETGIHTNTIAKNIANVFGGVSYVINAPAILDSAESKTMLMEDSNTKELFDHLRKLECVLFSLGDFSLASSYVKLGVLNDKELEYLKRVDIVGDINLHFINENGKYISNDITNRVIALPLSNIQQVKNKIGVVVEKRKSGILKAALQGKYLDILLITKQLADTLV